MERKVLMTPGPATTSRGVKEAQVVPDICPREEEFGRVMEDIREKLIRIAGGDENYECVLMGGPGTAGMEATLSSVVNGKVLIINNGAYGERFVKIAKCYNMDFKEVVFGWDEEINPEKVEAEIDEGVKYIVMIHHETTTGILNPVEKISELAKKHNCVFILDAISSFAGLPIDVKKLNVDFLISSSNKCIQGMPGICFIICKKEELVKLKEVPKRGFYLNMYLEHEYVKLKKQTRFTPPVQTAYALKKAIEEFFEEGAEKRYGRYQENNKILLEGMAKLGFKKIFPDHFEESGLLTTFFDPDNKNYSFDKMHDGLYKRGFTIYPGKIKEKTFRLSNLGDLNIEDIKKFIEELKKVMKEMDLELISA
ncbi:2-aminoethylphosphonate aminotransferase [Nanoarchaeota archaeon]